MENRDLLSHTAQIVSSHLSHNPATQEQIPGLIREVYSTLIKLGGMQQSLETQVEDRPSPAVPIKKSVFADHIVCLEDGKKLKMLKRHLMTAYQMTPDDYRKRWGLPSDYPMVAPNYAQTRSSLAKKIGLGRRSVDANEGTANGYHHTGRTASTDTASVRQIAEGVSGKRPPGRPRKYAA